MKPLKISGSSFVTKILMVVSTKTHTYIHNYIIRGLISSSVFKIGMNITRKCHRISAVMSRMGAVAFLVC